MKVINTKQRNNRLLFHKIKFPTFTIASVKKYKKINLPKSKFKLP